MKQLYLVIIICITSTVLMAQGDTKWPPIDASPMDVAYHPAEVAYRNYLQGDKRNVTPQIKLVYSRPQMKGRQIFGDLIAHGSEWRIGANEATLISFYQPVGIGKATLQAGNYTLAANVNKDSWTIHVSTETGIWGIANRDPDQVVASVTIPTERLNETVEALSMTFHEIDEDLVHLVVQWENTRVRVPINFNPLQFNTLDVSPLDMSHYPANSAYTNYLKDNNQNITPKATVSYHRPAKKNREIFGSLVPYNKVWRLGANEATELMLYHKTIIQGESIEPGRYILYAEVGENNWNLIFSKDLPSWGAYNRDVNQDVASVMIPVHQESESIEHLTIIFEEKADDSIDMIIAWDQTRAVANMIFNP